ncbi:MAG: hypothetical protein AB1726_05080 [Planctomycetota bacterium]
MATKDLYTEADVRALAAGSELVLGERAIATPAALDLAHARGIRVRWADGTVTPGAARAEHDCLWHRILAADGSYVVEVAGGRARVTRLTEAGPAAFGTDCLEAHAR